MKAGPPRALHAKRTVPGLGLKGASRRAAPVFLVNVILNERKPRARRAKDLRILGAKYLTIGDGFAWLSAFGSYPCAIIYP